MSVHRWRRVQSVSKVPINLGFKSSNGSCMRAREREREREKKKKKKKKGEQIRVDV